MPTSEEDTTETQSLDDRVSAEELQEQANTVQDLRDELAKLEAERVSHESDLSNQIAMTQLKGEEARLRAELAYAKGAVEGGAVEQANTPLATAKEQMEEAVVRQEASEAAARGEVYEPPAPEAESGPPEVNEPSEPESPVAGAFVDATDSTDGNEGSAV